MKNIIFLAALLITFASQVQNVTFNYNSVLVNGVKVKPRYYDTIFKTGSERSALKSYKGYKIISYCFDGLMILEAAWIIDNISKGKNDDSTYPSSSLMYCFLMALTSNELSKAKLEIAVYRKILQKA